MAKLPAIWDVKQGNAVASQTSGALLLENGSYLLLEDGTSHLLLEGVVFTKKAPAQWDSL
jgi:hypothetical protein